MKRWTRLAGMTLMLGLLATGVQAKDVSIFERKERDMPRRFGIQFLGAGNMFAMGDVNDYRAAENHQTNDANANFGIGGGFALLYRSHQNFRWTIGYSFLGQDGTEAAWLANPSDPNSVQVNEHTVNGSELYIMGNYLLRMGDVMHLSFSGGPALYTGTLDRRSSGQSFYDATGRGIGLRGGVGLQFMFGKSFGLHAMAGYRQAVIPKLVYENQNGVEQVVYWGGANRQFALDFSGAFLEAGVRLYFEPATEWFKL